MKELDDELGQVKRGRKAVEKRRRCVQKKIVEKERKQLRSNAMIQNSQQLRDEARDSVQKLTVSIGEVCRVNNDLEN